MLIPSIDLQSNQTVQLIGGQTKALDAGDPRPIAKRFALAGEVAVIDLDAAIGTGHNRELITDLLHIADCRVGGGIRSYDAARDWLDAGAAKIILGTAATPELLSKLPKERLIAAVDANHGEVVVKGWRQGTGEKLLDVITRLKPYVAGFLVTFVEREGRMVGIDLNLVAEVVRAAHPIRVTVAGGIAEASEIAAIDRLGADAQVGMALYTGRFSLAQAIAAPLSSDRPDGLIPTIVCDELNHALGLCYSSLESLEKAVELQQGVYWSRTRGLWIKGLTSGNTQQLLRITPDCDRDCLRFTVRHTGPTPNQPFCHLNTHSCFGDATGLQALEHTLHTRKANAPAGSYTARLFREPNTLRAKLLEEANELLDAADSGNASHTTEEAADLLYFTAVLLAKHNISLAQLNQALDRRAKKITRRPGHPKPPPP